MRPHQSKHWISWRDLKYYVSDTVIQTETNAVYILTIYLIVYWTDEIEINRGHNH